LKLQSKLLQKQGTINLSCLAEFAGSLALRLGRGQPTMFSVYRSHTAQTPLREAWEQGDHALREAICQASHFVDLRLRQAPEDQGESREDQTRILFQAPVGVLFQIDKENMIVRILRSWAFRGLER
jgi:hypothetical protein